MGSCLGDAPLNRQVLCDQHRPMEDPQIVGILNAANSYGTKGSLRPSFYKLFLWIVSLSLHFGIEFSERT